MVNNWVIEIGMATPYIILRHYFSEIKKYIPFIIDKFNYFRYYSFGYLPFQDKINNTLLLTLTENIMSPDD